MIQKLRTKFICVIMAIIMLMLSIILGVVIHFTGQNMKTQSINMMRAIATSPIQRNNWEKDRERIRLPYFTVLVSRQGQLLEMNDGNFGISDEDDIRQIVEAALSEEAETGILDEYNLRFLRNKNHKGYTIVFADTAMETTMLRSMVLTCLLILLGASVPILGISILLSRWVIKPVEKAWDQQRQFVADASHELKTPLSVIMANAELMQQEDAGETDQRKHARNILAVTYQMRSLVENMLEMARVDNGALNVKFEKVDFSQLVSDAVLSFQLLYEEQGLSLEASVPEGVGVSGSEQHLYQVMDVLLDNALKYSTPRGTVSVRLTRTGRNCLLTVTSPGEELSKEDLKNIFKRFYRADKARAMNGSYGLGLSIAQSVVEAHKGKIWAESREGVNLFHVQLSATEC